MAPIIFRIPHKWLFLLILLPSLAGFLLFSRSGSALALGRKTPSASTYVHHFYQRDTRWNDEELGKPVNGKFAADQTIGNYGCGITSAAMVLNFYDIGLTPLELNNALAAAKSEAGFSGDLVYWTHNKAWDESTGGLVKGISKFYAYKESVLLENLRHGRPVIVYLDNLHYVVVVDFEEMKDAKTGKTTYQFYINDPYLTEEAGWYIEFEKNFLSKKVSSITEMIVIHTDVKAPVDGPLVDWPAIQAKYTALGGLEGELGQPKADDIYTTDPYGFVEYHTQEFDQGKIYSYKVGQDSKWQTYYLLPALAREYDRQGGLDGDLGRLTYDIYPSLLSGSQVLLRADTQEASLVYDPGSDEIETFNAESNYTAEYFNNDDLSGEAAVRRYEEIIQFTWEYSSPHPEIQPENFSARYSGSFTSGLPHLHTFFAWPRGGARIYVDGELLLDQWKAEGENEFSANKFIGKGSHTWTVEYRHGTGKANFSAAEAPWPLKIAWADVSQGGYQSRPQMAPPAQPGQPSEPAQPTQTTQTTGPTEPTQPGDNQWEELTRKAAEWLEEKKAELSRRIEEWLADKSGEVEQNLRQWLVQQAQVILLRFQQLLIQLVQQCCGSVSLSLTLALVAGMAVRRRRGR